MGEDKRNINAIVGELRSTLEQRFKAEEFKILREAKSGAEAGYTKYKRDCLNQVELANQHKSASFITAWVLRQSNDLITKVGATIPDSTRGMNLFRNIYAVEEVLSAFMAIIDYGVAVTDSELGNNALLHQEVVKNFLDQYNILTGLAEKIYEAIKVIWHKASGKFIANDLIEISQRKRQHLLPDQIRLIESIAKKFR